MSYLRESIGNLISKAERTITGQPDLEPTRDSEETQAKAFILVQVQALKNGVTIPDFQARELLQSFEQVLTGSPYAQTSLWMKQKKEQSWNTALLNEEKAMLQAWRQFGKDQGALKLGKYYVQLSTDRPDITLEFDENVMGLIRGHMPATQLNSEGRLVSDGRVAETRINWAFPYLLNILDQAKQKDPAADHADLDYVQLGFPVKQEPTITSSSTLLSQVVHLSFRFKEVKQ